MKYEITDHLREKYSNFQLDKLKNHTPSIKICPECDTTFDAKSYIFRPTAIYERINEFCSPNCRKFGAGRKNKKVFKEYICSNCNEEFIPHKKKPHQQFCSHKCYTLSLKGVSRPEVQRWVHKLHPPKNSVSDWETKWLSQFNLTHTQHIVTLDGRNYRVDGYNEHNNIIYEYLGSFWHGNPKIYNPSDINPVCKKSFGELYQKTIDRIAKFESKGYTVVYEWSSR